MTRKRLLILAGSMAVVAMLAVGAFATVFAAGSPTATPGTDQSSPAQTFLQRLANNLGITTDKLQQGLKDTANQYVDQALANGKITQQQADQAKQNIANGNGMNGLRKFFERRDQRWDMLRQATWNDAAKALNMSPQDLKSELQSGKSLKTVIQEKNMTVDQFVANVISEVKSQLDSKVQSGALSSQQEQKILDTLQTRLTNMINNGGPNIHWKADPSGTPSTAPSA